MKHWIFILIMLVTTQVFSQGVNFSLVAGLLQTGNVAGKVLDANETDTSLVFATVLIKELDLQVATDMEGAFSFQLSPGSYTLEVDFIGYQVQEFVVEVVGGETAQEALLLAPLKIQSAQLIEPIESFSF
ncbi:MAG: hypothetical protein COB98_08490 [Flavobacteriaceae bacterium]|nr:MAG: hypothetical protein COB98_08490 [Flavobacteriaceae bacterium]